jgi:nucleoside-diphosphate kinase
MKIEIMERTVVLVKPDGVQRGLIGQIISRFEQKGLHLVGLKMISLTDQLLDEWYVHHKDKPFFPGLKSYMKSYPVAAMLWQGLDAAPVVRKMIGVTRAREAEPGTIRGDFALSQQYNLIHASEDSAAAQREEKLMFKKDEIFMWDKLDLSQIYLDEERGK